MIIPQATRQNGTCVIEENKKIRVNTASASHSVLFEDVASIGVQKKELAGKWGTAPAAGLFFGLMIISMVCSLNEEWEIGLGIWGVAFIICPIVGFMFKSAPEYWDDVIIETRGGQKIIYSVDSGQGQKDMDTIEEARRKK